MCTRNFFLTPGNWPASGLYSVDGHWQRACAGIGNHTQMSIHQCQVALQSLVTLPAWERFRYFRLRRLLYRI